MATAFDTFERASRICATCRHWWNGASPDADDPWQGESPHDPDIRYGTCQLNPPIITKSGHLWPRTHFSRSCGQWVAIVDRADAPSEVVSGETVVPIRPAAA